MREVSVAHEEEEITDRIPQRRIPTEQLHRHGVTRRISLSGWQRMGQQEEGRGGGREEESEQEERRGEASRP